MPDAAISCANRFIVGGGVLDAPWTLRARNNPPPDPGRGIDQSSVIIKRSLGVQLRSKHIVSIFS